MFNKSDIPYIFWHIIFENMGGFNMKNQYLLDVLENVKKRNAGEPESIQTATTKIL